MLTTGSLLAHVPAADLAITHQIIGSEHMAQVTRTVMTYPEASRLAAFTQYAHRYVEAQLSAERARVYDFNRRPAFSEVRTNSQMARIRRVVEYKLDGTF